MRIPLKLAPALAARLGLSPDHYYWAEMRLSIVGPGRVEASVDLYSAARGEEMVAASVSLDGLVLT